MIDRKKRTIVIISLIVIAALIFWTQSRYPDLNRKAAMAEASSAIGDVSPWPVLVISADASFATKWFYTTVNWVDANKKGMTFGLLIAALILTLVQYYPPQRLGGRFKNTALGVAIGTPLGLCVNCAAPVFKSVLRSGRVETAFALMLSSPTLNVVVLTMVFSLFPFYMAVMKVLTSVIVIFVAMPLISRWLGREHALHDLPQDKHLAALTALPDPSLVFGVENWGGAVWNTLRDFGRKLGNLAIRLIPLMIFAGSLGALMALNIPTASLAEYDGIYAILVSAFIGVLLPVPVAFDVMLVSSLASQGLPPAVVLTLLCTLGSFSVLAFLFIWTSASKHWALMLLGVYFTIGSVAGLSANTLHDRFFVTPQLDALANLRNPQLIVAAPTHNTPNVASTAAQTAPEPVLFHEIVRTPQASISMAPFRQPEPYQGTATMAQFEGSHFGLVDGFRYGVRDYSDPFWIGRGTAAGDFNQDGWIDVAFGSNDGVYVYRNIGGRFEPAALGDAAENHEKVYAVAFVDLNNDGWLDLFFTTFNRGNYVVYNQNGAFDFARRQKLPNNEAILTVSPAFGDFDGNGLLDIVNGNMALGVVTGSHVMNQGRNNSLAFNLGDGKFRDTPLELDSGETMSTLVSDINNDGRLDIYFANDFIIPDRLLVGTENGFTPIVNDSNFLPATPFFSMSADTGDFDNDGRLDFVTMGTTGPAKNVGKVAIDSVPPQELMRPKWQSETCNGIKDAERRKQCIKVRNSSFLSDTHAAKNVDIEQCLALGDKFETQGCLLVAMWHLITNNVPTGSCDAQFGKDPTIREVCEILKNRARLITRQDYVNALPQIDRNLLYRFADGRLVDVNKAQPNAFDHPGGWTWNAKFVDLDNDGLLDVFNVDGLIRKNGFGWNVFMKNIDGKRFEQRQFSSGLVDDFGMYSFVQFDMDNDGDIDIIGNSAVGPVRVFENRLVQDNHSIAVSLRDEKGNRFGIGAKITIIYNGGKANQLREMKASGGYQSFDAPVAYFGLAKFDRVDEIHVRWLDGEETTYKQGFAAGNQYLIARNKAP